VIFRQRNILGYFCVGITLIKSTKLSMTISVELLHEDAIALLRDLEKMHILKLVQPKKTEQHSKTTKSRFAGRISQKAGSELQEQLKGMRDKWR